METFHREDLKRRIASELKEGDLVDFWNNYRWREGKIVGVDNLSKITIYKVQAVQLFSQWGSDSNEEFTFDSTSRLILKHRTYTRDEPRSLGSAQFRIEVVNMGDSTGVFLS